MTEPPSTSSPADSPAQPAAGKGMLEKKPRQQAPLAEGQETPQERAIEASLALPHERDQSSDMTPAAPDPLVKQAARDVKRGITDTSKGAEMDQAYKKLSR